MTTHIDTERIVTLIALKLKVTPSQLRNIELYMDDISGTIKVDVFLYGGGKLQFIFDAIRNQLLGDDMAKVYPTLVYDPARDMWSARCPFNKAWIDDFKHQVAGAARVWDPNEKVWRYDPMFHDCVKRLCEIHYGAFKEVKPETPPPPPPPPTNGASSIYRDFLGLCDKDALKKLYRASALKHHPDAGGDPSKMQELNVLWGQISKEFQIQ